jgi:hypothetical protein
MFRKLRVLALVLLPSLALADTNWDGSESTDWFDSDNWSSGLPGSNASSKIRA